MPCPTHSCTCAPGATLPPYVECHHCGGLTTPKDEDAYLAYVQEHPEEAEEIYGAAHERALAEAEHGGPCRW